jgi:hypothetical protein
MESAHTEKITRPLGAAFRSNTLKKLDGRTKTARRLREIISELTEHCGGVERVSAAQRYLIERTAIDIRRLAPSARTTLEFRMRYEAALD